MSAEQRVVGKWALSAQIGSGSFAVVWRARHVESGQEAAVKEINLSKLNAKLRQSLESEVSILKRINHDNIVKLHEVLEVRRFGGGGGGRCQFCRKLASHQSAPQQPATVMKLQQWQ
jgi:serine/threonine protein kinase